MKILVLYTLPPEKLPPGRTVDEFDLSYAADGIARSLSDAVTVGVRGEAGEILATLNARQPDVVFNLCEAPLGRSDLEAQAAALLEWQGVRFTGCSSETLALCRRKDRTQAVLAASGVPIPRGDVFPCIVKPVDEDGSVGIDLDSLCADAAAVERSRARIAGPVIVEEFLPGREFVVSLWGGDEPEFHSLGEVLFDDEPRLLTYAAKWEPESSDYANVSLDYRPELDSAQRDALLAAARRAWKAVGARGYLRVDARFDAAQIPRVLDVNPNPEVTPGRGGMYRAVSEAGWSWEQFAHRQVEWSWGANAW